MKQLQVPDACAVFRAGAPAAQGGTGHLHPFVLSGSRMIFQSLRLRLPLLPHEGGS